MMIDGVKAPRELQETGMNRGIVRSHAQNGSIRAKRGHRDSIAGQLRRVCLGGAAADNARHVHDATQLIVYSSFRLVQELNVFLVSKLTLIHER